MKIQDISDRVYQGRVWHLLDEARSSIVISMYLMRPGENEKHPVNRLFQDLIEARKRGVEITIYLNTKFKSVKNPAGVAEGPWFEKLRGAGVQIRLVSPVRMLHDKLLIVDRRFVVEGSMNWSVSAIAENHESATLIESPELAESKLRRAGFFPIWGEEVKKVPRPKLKRPVPEPLFPAGPPTSIEVPVALIEERRYFPGMIAYQRERAMKIFLLFLYLAQARGASRLGFLPETVGDYLGILPGEDRSAVRRQVIRVLRDLQTIDKLLQAEFRHGKAAFVELFIPKGPAFTLSSAGLEAGQMSELGDNQIFVRLIQARLREEGKRLEDLTQAQIKRRFFIDDATMRRTLGPRRSRKSAPATI